MKALPAVGKALLATTIILLLAAIDMASRQRPLAESDVMLALLGVLPVLVFALVAFAPRRPRVT